MKFWNWSFDCHIVLEQCLMKNDPLQVVVCQKGVAPFDSTFLEQPLIIIKSDPLQVAPHHEDVEPFESTFVFLH